MKKKNIIFQHEHQRLVKMCIYLCLFHEWFPLGFVLIYSVSFMYKYLLNSIKRKLQVQEENMSCQRALNFHQWKIFSKNYKAIRVWLWPVYKFTGSIVESKGMHAIFQKKGKKEQKRAKYLKIWAKKYKIWKYFEKGKPHACDYHMHETARICWFTKNNCHLQLFSNFIQTQKRYPTTLDKIRILTWKLLVISSQNFS